MTWIVGMPTPFGFSVGISDIRVSMGTSERDCLQKIYQVAPGVALGFSGNVCIGFEMVAQLSKLLGSLRESDPRSREIHGWWPVRARSIFQSFEQTYRDGGCSLMLFISDPAESAGEVPRARTAVYVFHGPEFEAESLATLQPYAIGSGAYEETCIEALRKVNSDENIDGLLKSIVAGPGAMASVLAFEFSRSLQEALPSGISPHLHICIVARGQVFISPNNYQRMDKDGPVPFTMPHVATSWSELSAMLDAKAAAAAVADRSPEEHRAEPGKA